MRFVFFSFRFADSDERGLFVSNWGFRQVRFVSFLSAGWDRWGILLFWSACSNKWGLFITELQYVTSEWSLFVSESTGWDRWGYYFYCCLDLQVETNEVCLFPTCRYGQVRIVCFRLQIETSDVYFRSAGWDNWGLFVLDLQVETSEVCFRSACPDKWDLFLNCLSGQVRFVCFRSTGSDEWGLRSPSQHRALVLCDVAVT